MLSKEKLIQQIENDGDFLHLVEVLYKSYMQYKNNSLDELPETVKKLLLQSIENSIQGNVRPHNEVMEELRKKYNIAG